MTREKKPLRIAILGTRGIPASYGGFETFAEELATRLAARGHDVTVFGRRKFFESDRREEYSGVRLRNAPTVFWKYLETPLQGLTSFLFIKKNEFDAVLFCNAANSPFSWILRLKGIPSAVNVDGIERNRAKWNSIGKAWYHLGEWCSVRFPSAVIADAKVIQEYYFKKYGHNAVVIPYGASAVRRPPGGTLERFKLTPRGYILYVSRLEPENNALGVVQAFSKVQTSMRLVVVGDAPYAKGYISRVKEAADERVVFTGFQFGAAYQELQSSCYAYIQATEVGGTHPALVEAMAYGNCIVANGTPENIEVLGEGGLFYPQNDFEALSRILGDLLKSPGIAVEQGERAKKRARDNYDWEKVTDQYEELMGRLTKAGGSGTNKE